MNIRPDTKRIELAVEALTLTQHSRRLAVLKSMVLKTGGRWDLPSQKLGEYDPIIKSAELFGVHAMAEDVAELAKNWIKAARNVLDGAADEQAVSTPSAAPGLGDEVWFQRTPTHHPEVGIVRGRQFSTGIIEVEDGNAEQIRLEPTQYEVIANA